MVVESLVWWPSGAIVRVILFIDIHIDRLPDGKGAQRRITLLVHPAEARIPRQRPFMRAA